jgi:hypothetical protein
MEATGQAQASRECAQTPKQYSNSKYHKKQNTKIVVKNFEQLFKTLSRTAGGDS